MLKLPTAAMLMVLAAPALAGARQDGKVIMPENAEAKAFMEQFGFAEAVVTADGTIYMSGVVAGLGNDNNFEAAYERAFKEMGEILSRAGANWDDVVDMTTFHTDMSSQLAPISSVKARYIKAPFPTWTAIEVVRLYPDRGITEIKLVAKVSKPR